MENKQLVNIICLAFNQAPYIRKCLEGFVMQKTNFKFKAIIHDDASTDDTAEIIKEFADKYVGIIDPIIETENQYSKIGFSSIINGLISKSSSKYIAFCEGDDYWIDPYKLQKQVDYLESHSGCGLIYTQVFQLDQDTQSMRIGWARQSDFNDAITGDNPISTPTVCFRKSLYNAFRKDVVQDPNWKMADFPLWLYLAYHSEIKYLEDVTGVYRILLHSASHSTDLSKLVEFSLSGYQVRKYFVSKYKCFDLLPKVNQFEINDLFKLSIRFDKSLLWRIFSFAKENSYITITVIIKCLIYSTKLGRKFHRHKYFNNN
jgi:glycosyltransferase involved in cell wall biosynthesis